jgi:trans-aconitate methyltransferase
MSNTSNAPHQDRWGEYYKVAAGHPPRELLRQTVIRFGPADHPSRLAIDLGCGAGTETVALLSQGWRVLAIDQQSEAIAHVMARVAPEHQARLATQLVSFEHVEFPASDFIWASLSLPFCPPAHFPDSERRWWPRSAQAVGLQGISLACVMRGPIGRR